MDLDDSLELIKSVMNQYFDEQLFDIYNSTISVRDKFISYEQFKKDCRGLNIAKNKTSNKSSKEIVKENEDILAMFKKDGD